MKKLLNAFVLGLALSACSIYDNYDVDLVDGTMEIASLSSCSAEEQLSSSLEMTSSSSIEIVSSSSGEEWSCGSPLDYGGQLYNTVLIKERCWMAENLNFEQSFGNSLCYENNPSYCNHYGRLYDYEAANSACPSGWRLPTSSEYEQLRAYTGVNADDAGVHFKTESGWDGENGDDKLKFSALPGGHCDYNKQCNQLNRVGIWWTSTEKVIGESNLVMMLSADNQMFNVSSSREIDNYYSVRCIKN